MIAGVAGSPLAGKFPNIRSVFQRLETTLESPTSCSGTVAGSDAALDAWEEVPASEMGYTYYYNHAERRSAWVLPRDTLEAKLTAQRTWNSDRKSDLEVPSQHQIRHSDTGAKDTAEGTPMEEGSLVSVCVLLLILVVRAVIGRQVRKAENFGYM
jgi:hypothetical protein